LTCCFPSLFKIELGSSGRWHFPVLSLAGHEAQPPGLQQNGDVLLHGQGNVRVETFHAGDLVAHAGLHGDATVSIFVQPLLAAVTKQVQPLPGVRGRGDLRKGTAGGDQLGLVQANPREFPGGRSTARGRLPVADVCVGQQPAANGREQVLVLLPDRRRSAPPSPPDVPAAGAAPVWRTGAGALIGLGTGLALGSLLRSRR
jgi:hypothetical protein